MIPEDSQQELRRQEEAGKHKRLPQEYKRLALIKENEDLMLLLARMKIRERYGILFEEDKESSMVPTYFAAVCLVYKVSAAFVVGLFSADAQ